MTSLKLLQLRPPSACECPHVPHEEIQTIEHDTENLIVDYSWKCNDINRNVEVQSVLIRPVHEYGRGGFGCGEC